MDVHGTFEPRDSWAVHWLLIKPRPAYAVLGVLLLALFAWAMWYSLQSSKQVQPDWMPWVLLGSAGYLALHYCVYLPYRIKRTFRLRKDVQRPISFDISESALLIRTETGQESKPWTDFYRWKEDQRVFLLYISDVAHIVIPKRFFHKSSDIDTFRSYVTSRIHSREA